MLQMEIKWEDCANGIWKTIIGCEDKFNPVLVMDAAPVYEKLRKLTETNFPQSVTLMEYEITNGKTIIRIPLQPEERIYGLGLQFMKMNHRGKTRYLHVNSDPKQDTGESHAPVPFYLSTGGYGLFINTSRAITIYCGSCVRKDSKNPPKAKDNVSDPDFDYTPLSDLIEVVIPGNGTEIFAFSGSSLLEIVQRYNLYFGGGVLPPKWGLGFWHRAPSAYTGDQVVKEALEYRKRGFPCDVIGLEPGWHSKSYPVTYEWSQERFSDPSAFVSEMAENGFKINLWEHAYVSPEAKIFTELEPYAGSHTVWAGIIPDYSVPEVRKIIKAQHRQEHIDIGISGYKLDECDGSELTDFSWMFPAHATFPSGNDGEQMRQLLGLLFQKTTAELFYEVNKRTYGMVRASNAAASTLPYVLYSDLYDHEQFIRALCNSSFSGLLWTPEVRTAQSSEDWVRRFQTVCFSPIAILNAWADGTKPWSYPEVYDIILHYVNLRMRLIPYFYSAFAKYNFEGIPPFRAMHLEEGYNPAKVSELYKEASGFEKTKSWDIFQDEVDNQYMAGDFILVAPLLAGQKERFVYLPEGKWYYFDTGKEFTGGNFIKIEATIDKLPLFVKDGGIIPMIPAYNHVPAKGVPVPLEIRHYGMNSGKFLLYEDDGESLDYKKGNYQWFSLEVNIEDNGKKTGKVSGNMDKFYGSYSEIKWNFIDTLL